MNPSMQDILKSPDFNNRILICDDTEDIHHDFRKILSFPARSEKEAAIEDFENALFSDEPDYSPGPRLSFDFQIDSAFQGKEALEMAERAHEAGKPYAVIFMDVRMPPGWDGILTVERIWKKLPLTEVVIVTAYSDYSWDEMVTKLGINDKLLFIKKPFDSTVVKQSTLNLLYKWNLNQRARQHIIEMDREILGRMKALDKAIRGM
jgi:CheY-like chemotaxis protein